MSTALPTEPAELTQRWLQGALDERFPGVEVTGCRVEETMWGTATKVMLDVDYAADPGPDGPPRRLCVKGGFDERLAGFDTLICYQLEAAFYADLADEIDTTLPRWWYAASDDAQGIVVLDDLAAAGCSFGSPLEPWTPDAVAAALESQAQWHARFWDSAPGRHDWLEVGSGSVRAASHVLLGAEHWERTFSADGAPQLPPDASERERVERAMHELWRRDDGGTLTFLHGDAHIGNTYIDPERGPGFLDWQCICLGPAMYDVAYFVSGALSVDDRRTHEADLLAHYLQALAAAGGPTLTPDEMRASYVDHLVHGIHWAVTPPVMQSAERVAAMAERHLAAVEDHQAVSTILGDRWA